MSPPYGVDMEDERVKEHYLELIREDLKAQIAFVEEHTGKKLDIAKLREVVENSQKAAKLWYDTLELRKAVPCPMNTPDYFSGMIPQMWMPGSEEGVKFYQDLYNEVKQRVDNKVGVIPEEKCRLIWYGIPPWFNLGLFNYFESLGAVFVSEIIYYVGPPVDIDLSDPLEALIQRVWLKALWLHKQGLNFFPDNVAHLCIAMPMNTNFVRQQVKDFKIDGAVMHRTRSCRAASWGETFIKNDLAKDGTPSLIFESDIADPRAWSDAQFKTQVDAFMEILTAKKK